MAYLVMDACIRCKHTDCVEVCPVDCFYEGENMLVIHPDECIDCGVCEPECPVEAIKPESEDDPDGRWLALNTKYANIWPNISRMKEPLEEYQEFTEKENKYEDFFSPNPGEGD
ncbi:MAG: ferredoxin family protein [Bacteroidetes bacterium]|nr:ferredoxin family protein [Bacteroidota bacterium]MCY4224893.1 ferredoxin family protein [Bacteroidota bacterium]